MTSTLRTEAPLVPDPPWFGELPPHWETWRLKHLVRFESGGTPSKSEGEFWRGTIPWVSPKDMKAERISDAEDHITPEAVRGSATRLVPAGTVLLVVRSGILRHSIPVAVATREVSLNQDLKALIPRGQILPEYLAATIRGHTSPLLVAWRKAGATVDSLEMELVENTPFPVPPLPDQQAIANFLDRKTAEIDALLEEKQRLLDLLEEKRTALITQAVTKGLDPDVEMKDSGVEWLGEVPAHWEMISLKRLVAAREMSVQMGPYGSMLTGIDYRPSDYRVYGQENTISGDFAKGSRWIDEERYRSLADYKLKAGDLILTRKGSIGNACLVPEGIAPGIIDSDTIRVRIYGRAVRRTFLVRLLKEAWYVTAQIQAHRRGAVVGGLNTTVISNLQIALPPPDDQADIEHHLDHASAQLSETVGEMRRGQSLLHEYRTALISAAVTGKIDVREEAA